MSIDRHPARLSTINLRRQLDAMENKPTKPEKSFMGLLSPKKRVEDTMDTVDNEYTRVLNYMQSIRNSMRGE